MSDSISDVCSSLGPVNGHLPWVIPEDAIDPGKGAVEIGAAVLASLGSLLSRYNQKHRLSY